MLCGQVAECYANTGRIPCERWAVLIGIGTHKRSIAKEKFGVDLIDLNLLSDPILPDMKNTFDMVCMFNVLEHLTNPVAVLKKAIQSLRPGGRIIVEVPNEDERLKQFSENYRKFSYYRGHLSYFTPESLRNTFREAGLSEAEISGKQQYSLENIVHWLRNSEPFLEYPQLSVPDGIKWVDAYYRETLEKMLASDFLIGVGTV
jgi:SAM-dependent methyltransferase